MITKVDDLSHPAIAKLLKQHMEDIGSALPPESVHALDLASLRRPEITFWSIWENSMLLGCGASKEMDASHGEVRNGFGGIFCGSAGAL